MKFSVRCGNKKECFEVEEENGAIIVLAKNRRHRIVLDHYKRCIRSAEVDRKKLTFAWRKKEDKYEVQIGGICYEVIVSDTRFEHLRQLPKKAITSDDSRYFVTAPIPGLITAVKIKAGDKVKKDDSLVTLDAMKLQNDIFTPRDGKIAEVKVKVNDTVDKGAVLVVIE